MQFTNTITFLAITFMASSVSAQYGRRACLGGAISCEYGAGGMSPFLLRSLSNRLTDILGRCALVCNSTVCECPETTDARYPWTGAQCINVATALGRFGCP